MAPCGKHPETENRVAEWQLGIGSEKSAGREPDDPERDPDIIPSEPIPAPREVHQESQEHRYVGEADKEFLPGPVSKTRQDPCKQATTQDVWYEIEAVTDPVGACPDSLHAGRTCRAISREFHGPMEQGTRALQGDLKVMVTNPPRCGERQTQQDCKKSPPCLRPFQGRSRHGGWGSGRWCHGRPTRSWSSWNAESPIRCCRTDAAQSWTWAALRPFLKNKRHGPCSPGVIVSVDSPCGMGSRRLCRRCHPCPRPSPEASNSSVVLRLIPGGGLPVGALEGAWHA